MARPDRAASARPVESPHAARLLVSEGGRYIKGQIDRGERLARDPSVLAASAAKIATASWLSCAARSSRRNRAGDGHGRSS